jgi:hypothetical protein
MRLYDGKSSVVSPHKRERATGAASAYFLDVSSIQRRALA